MQPHSNRAARFGQPQGLSNSCCGMMFNTRGFKDAAAKKGQEFEQALLRASGGACCRIAGSDLPAVCVCRCLLTCPFAYLVQRTASTRWSATPPPAWPR